MLIAPLLLGGCASGLIGEACGGSLPANPTMTAACAGARNDKQAIYELGLRYETGDGLSVDLKKARNLYRLAASDTPDTIYAYSPGFNGMAGRVIPINTGRGGPGLDVARTALARVEAALAKDN
jgi:hypothetical protein